MFFSRPKPNSINKALTAAAAALCLSQAASAVEVAPYFHSWGGSLNEAKQSAGMTSAILAFATTYGNCAFVPDLTNKIADARNYVAGGGRLMISFGGQDGVYAEIACKDDNQLFTIMEKLITDTGTRRFDFDIEGPQLLNTEGTARRARVLARLQARYPDLFVSFTLPGWLRGLDANGMNLLKTTKAAGVRIDMVNMMAMSFGAGNIASMVSGQVTGADPRHDGHHADDRQKRRRLDLHAGRCADRGRLCQPERRRPDFLLGLPARPGAVRI
jgi:Glycosyl hydrolases family 18